MTVSLNVLYSDEAIAEVKKFLNSRDFYLNTDGTLAFSCATDTVKEVLQYMTN